MLFVINKNFFYVLGFELLPDSLTERMTLLVTIMLAIAQETFFA